ncbi:hypothetical protein [Synechococcus sp. 1G10]|uniref:hypothetical protein n=1 Tax=Synechococcus sp. 1G10 TaxID=2025605 RepID=UPI001180E072|nr:hypothetical protein [Synechococcus sp. 1G10]
MQEASTSALLSRFAHEYGLDLSALTDEPIAAGPSDSYRILPGAEPCGHEPLLRQITALQIRSPMRFGNSLIQLSNAIELAGLHGISRIYAPGFWWVVSSPAPVIPAIQVITNLAGPQERILEGMFYYKRTLRTLYQQPEKCIDAIRNNLFHVRQQIPLLKAREPLRDDHLVLHIRSGDVFHGKGHPLYGQPPLSFYTLILRRWPWRKATIVSEDRLNPVIDRLLGGTIPNLPPMEHRTASLQEDLELLLRARSLVCSLGTFMPAVLSLSANVRRVILFERLWYARTLQQRADLLVVKDSVGDYCRGVLDKNWQNSKQQRELMLGYPEGRLQLSHLSRHATKVSTFVPLKS